MALRAVRAALKERERTDPADLLELAAWKHVDEEGLTAQQRAEVLQFIQLDVAQMKRQIGDDRRGGKK